MRRHMLQRLFAVRVFDVQILDPPVNRIATVKPYFPAESKASTGLRLG